MAWLTTIADLSDPVEAQRVRQARYGVVETRAGRFERLTLRPWPKLALPWDVVWGDYRHRSAQGDRCWLFYNQPRSSPDFLALKFVVSSQAATLATFRAALVALDEIARLKRTDAIVCDAVNWRISDRLMVRWGWQPHKPQRWHRNFIKRFYGAFPAAAGPNGAL